MSYCMTYKGKDPHVGGKCTEIRIRDRVGAVDNRWVVPYSPKLLLMFQCHLTVELCLSRVGSIKFLIKYVFKGHDRVTVQVAQEKIESMKYYSIKMRVMCLPLKLAGDCSDTRSFGTIQQYSVLKCTLKSIKYCTFEKKIKKNLYPKIYREQN